MRHKKGLGNFGKALLMVALAIIILTGLVAIEIWLTNWLGFTGYFISMVLRVLGLGFMGLVMMKMFK